MITHKTNKNRRGFTLIELLVVIAIVALLASVALVALNQARRDSRDTKRIADIKQIASALEIYFDEFGRYPHNGSLDGYNDIDNTFVSYRWDSSCGGGSPDDPFLTPLSDEGIMSILPDDPSYTTSVYCYSYSSTDDGSNYKNKYYLRAYMENESTGQNNCDLDFSSYPNIFCVMNTED